MAKPEGDRIPKTLEQRGFYVLDVHAHPNVKGGYPPAMKPRCPPENTPSQIGSESRAIEP